MAEEGDQAATSGREVVAPPAGTLPHAKADPARGASKDSGATAPEPGLAAKPAAAPAEKVGEHYRSEIDIEAVAVAERSSGPGDTGLESSPDSELVTRWRAGFSLGSSEQKFGGFSGMLIEDDRLLAISDRGFWWQALLVHSPEGTLTGLSGGRMASLSDLDGSPVAGRDRHDAEELTRWRGQVLVAFEGEHRLHAYREPVGGAATPRLFTTPMMRGIHENRGLEAVTSLQDQRLFLVAEGDGEEAVPLQGWISTVPEASPRAVQEGSSIQDSFDALGWHELKIESTDAFRPTAAAVLPDGDVLLVQRSFNPEDGVRILLSRIPVLAFGEGGAPSSGVIVPREIARLSPPLPIDNMEAVDVTLGPQGEIFVYLLADDNFSDSQETLLLQLELSRR